MKDFFVDVDPTVDADGDGNPGNDRDSDSGATASGFLRDSEALTLAIGPFDVPGKRKVRVTAIDTNDNASEKDFTVDVYVPTPTIQGASGISASGVTADLVRGGEPIDLFRFRAGKLERLSSSGNVYTNEVGGFGFGFATGGPGLELKKDGKTVADINEKTGNIDLKDHSYRVEVIPADANGPMRFDVKDPNGGTAYSETVTLPESLGIARVASWPADGNGVYVKSAPDAFVRNAANASSLPGGAFLVDLASHPARQAFAGIGSDGNIHVLQDGYSLEYRNEGPYPKVTVTDPSGATVAEILYRLDSEFVIK